jgi:methionyl-tRNA formyltransferase
MRVLDMDLSTSDVALTLNDDCAPLAGPRSKLQDVWESHNGAAERAATAPKLKVFVITEEDPIYVIEFFRVFFSEYPASEFDLCGIMIDQPFHESLVQTLRRVTRFYGWWGALRQCVRFIDARVRSDLINALAASAQVPVVAARSVNDAQFIQRLQAEKPDVIVSVAAPEIFGPELLKVPRLGCINIHSGRLPNYRGMMPTFWQMLQGEQAVTISVHAMAQTLDTGDVLATQSFPIEGRDSLDRVIRGTKREGARLLIRVLRNLHRGQVQLTPLDMTQARYFSFPKPSDVRKFRKRGHRLL